MQSKIIRDNCSSNPSNLFARGLYPRCSHLPRATLSENCSLFGTDSVAGVFGFLSTVCVRSCHEHSYCRYAYAFNKV